MERAKEMWAGLARQDNVQHARGCIESGWGWPDKAATSLKAPGDLSFLWVLMDLGATEITKWALGASQFQTEFFAQAKSAPRSTWWPIAAKSVPSLQRLLDIGLPIDQQDQDGNTVAHEAMGEAELKKSMVAFWLKNHPGLLVQPNHAGKTPLSFMPSELRSYAEEALMQRGTVQAHAPKTKQRRL